MKGILVGDTETRIGFNMDSMKSLNGLRNEVMARAISGGIAKERGDDKDMDQAEDYEEEASGANQRSVDCIVQQVLWEGWQSIREERHPGSPCRGDVFWAGWLTASEAVA